MRLLIDIGNQRLKWLAAVATGECKTQPQGVISNQSDSFDSDLEKQFGELIKPDSIWIASVSREDIKDEVVTYASQKWELSPNFIQVTEQFKGVVNHYSVPSQLGVDRWAAMIAARNLLERRRAAIVIDAGTAVTIDYIDIGGHYMGGVIFPGIQTMKRALNTQTEKITISPVWTNQKNTINMLNIDTGSAVSGGANLAVLSAIESGISRLKRMFEINAEVVITGGDAQKILDMSDFDMHLEKNLVLKGIELLAREEELK